MYQLGLNSAQSAHEGAVLSLFILSVLQNYFVEFVVQSVHKTVLGVILLNSCIWANSTRAELDQVVKHTYSSGTLMFLKINEFFACQDNNSLFLRLLNLGNCLLLFINKVTLKTGIGLYKED